jgi:hypothetical protein
MANIQFFFLFSQNDFHRRNHTRTSLHQLRRKPNASRALVTSDTEIFLEEEMKMMLKDYFLKNFKPEIFFEFFHSSNIENNEVFTYVSEIFEQPELLENQSKKLAKLLYEHSTNPRTKGGEFYVCYFKDLIVKGERYDAVGLFKSENKDTFLKVSPKK